MGGIIRDTEGNMQIAFSMYLDQGTSNWAESQAMLIGLQLSKAYNMNVKIVEADSQVLVQCIKGEIAVPWRLTQAKEEIKERMEAEKFHVQHCFREGNRVADKFAAYSHIHKRKLIFTTFANLPKECRV